MDTHIQYQELIDRLLRLDEDISLIYDDNVRYECVIVGGGALILMNYISRATHDIDVIQCNQELQKLFYKYDFNTRVQTYISNFPFNFQDRFIKVNIETKRIDYYTASLEDIVIAKLASVRQSDIRDVTEQVVLDKINWNLLDQLSIECKDSALNESNYNNFKANYDEYVRRYMK